MITNSQIKSTAFHVIDIQILDFGLNSNKGQVNESIQIKFNVTFKYQIEKAKNQVKCLCMVDYLMDNFEDKVGFCNVGIAYEIHGLDENATETSIDDEHLLELMVPSLTSNALITVRGVSKALFRGTVLHNVIIPDQSHLEIEAL